MNISTTDARALFTKQLIDVFRESPMATSFLRSFFPSVESATKELSIEVQRGTEKVAVDVIRGSEGNRNSFNKSTEKIFVPPYFREYLEATELDLYDRLFGSTEISSAIFAQLMQTVAEKLGLLRDKIERAYELQCSQVLETGIVTLNNGDNIDFKRKAGSLVDASGTPWSNDSYDPLAQLATGARWMRSNGKTQGNMFDVIMGSSAKAAFNKNAFVKAVAGQFQRINFLDLREPQRNAVGAISHGIIAAEDYLFRVWTYPEMYDNASNVQTAYMNAKKIVMLPENPRFKLGFAAVPQLIDEKSAPVKGAYVIGEYKDQRKASHVFDIQSAGVAIPVAVDQIYTTQVIA